VTQGLIVFTACFFLQQDMLACKQAAKEEASNS